MLQGSQRGLGAQTGRITVTVLTETREHTALQGDRDVQTASSSGPQADWLGRRNGQASQPRVNVGEGERIASVAAGSILALLGLSRRSIPGVLLAGLGGALIHRGVTGHCYAYEALDMDTAGSGVESRKQQLERIARHGIHAEQVFLINRPADELYRFWRDFQNLPRIMTHLERVDVIDDLRSHWVARAPRLAGGTVEWDAEITADEPNSLIAWRSLPGADMDHAGQIRFARALGDRGTEVHVEMDYVPPAGRAGDWIARLFGKTAKRLIREDLRNFKRLMEVGEIPTIIGQPHGTCTGVGERYTE